MPHVGEIPDEINMTRTASPEAGVGPDDAEVHLCDNYAKLLLAMADLASRESRSRSPRPLVLFIEDRLPLGDDLGQSLAALTNAEIVRVSDHSAIESFARLPRFLPPMLRRNLSWTGAWTPVRPSTWTPAFLSGRRFGTGYVYHPGFFLSKVVAGHSDRVVMRDDGYANYVRHRVPLKRVVPRLLAGRSPRYQTWGEEPWVDEIQVVRPDQLPHRIQHKASRLMLDDLMSEMSDHQARKLANAFWGSTEPPATGEHPTALILTQPLDQLGICTTTEKADLYQEIVDRVRKRGLDIVVKCHPRERKPVLQNEQQIPAAFPIEAWIWIGQPRFDLAVSLNSTSLSDPKASFAQQTLQLIPPERFYAEHWKDWPALIDGAFDDPQTGELSTTQTSGKPQHMFTGQLSDKVTRKNQE